MYDPVDPDLFEPIETLDLVGGQLCFDFVNTASQRRRGPFRDRLQDYDDLVVWARRVDLVTEADAASLLADAARRPAEAARALAGARALREVIYRVFSAGARGDEPSAEDLAELNAALSEAGHWRRVVRDETGWTWAWSPGEEPLSGPLWPVAQSAGDLLTSGETGRIKECGGENCNWLFYDASKNRSRRWCDMKDCGNRAKQRRHRRKSADS